LSTSRDVTRMSGEVLWSSITFKTSLEGCPNRSCRFRTSLIHCSMSELTYTSLFSLRLMRLVLTLLTILLFKACNDVSQILPSSSTSRNSSIIFFPSLFHTNMFVLFFSRRHIYFTNRCNIPDIHGGCLSPGNSHYQYYPQQG
jgi:hypothetical protein